MFLIKIGKHVHMKHDARIYVAGHTGLVGSALVRLLKQEQYNTLIVRSMDQLDLRHQEAVNHFFATEKPEYVFLAAAKVGGIFANSHYPADFIYDNLMIVTNVIHAAYVHGVKKLLFFGSSCIYPRDSAQPMLEEHLLTGPLEETNKPYALAKIAGITLCQAYNKQYGTSFISCMPTNVYGPGDTFDANNSHVIPALIHKIYQAHIHKAPTVTVWGTGKPLREFLYVDDLAQAALLLMQKYTDSSIINIGSGTEITIAALAEYIKNIIGYTGTLMYDSHKPDGAMRKLVSSKCINAFGWVAQTDLEQGLKKTISWYSDNYMLSQAQEKKDFICGIHQ